MATFTSMRNLAAGNVVLESDMDAIRTNIELIEDLCNVYEEDTTASDTNTTSTTWTDSGCGVSVTLTYEQRVLVVVSGNGWSAGAAQNCLVNLAVDGTVVESDTDGIAGNYGTSPHSISFSYILTVAAGTHTIDLYYRTTDAGSAAYLRNPRMFVQSLVGV